MRSFWQIESSHICSLQGKSTEFVRLLNALITAQSRAGGLVDASLQLNQADTIPDGGVDAVVSESIPALLDPTGWFTVPTSWQFKAQPTSNIKPSSKAPDKKQETALREEINKPHAAKLVKLGYGFRLCIADELPPASRTKWNEWLNDEAKKLNPNVPSAFVVTASDLVLWVNRYPAIALDFRPGAFQMKTLAVWQQEVRALTPSFVTPATWQFVLNTISNHINFDLNADTILTIQGEAGVGKTRSACEALACHPAIEAMVAVTSDEQSALVFAQAISSDRNSRAILVADECSLQYRERLRRILPGCSDRLRVIAIDNSLQRAEGAGEIRITQMSPAEVLQILDMSFPDLPSDRRRTFTQLARGFIRLAVDLCQHDHLVPISGRLDGVFGHFEDSYLVSRLEKDELATVQVISLLPRVGFRDDTANELKELCAHPAINLDSRKVVEIATQLKQSPGFIAFGGRFLYVTPTLISQVAFQSAWGKWVSPDPSGFLQNLSPSLLDGFIEQARRAPNPELARAVSNFFLNWATGLGPPDLAVEATAVRLVRLIESDPDLFLPLLKRLLEGMPEEELQTLHALTIEGQNARRQIVWLAEKLAQLPDYFTSAEQLLFRLALAESEPHLGNSATRVWTSLYRIVQSGTPTPFPDRLKLLEKRLREARDSHLPMLIDAFNEILKDVPITGLTGSQVILGRVPPPVWRPNDHAERQACLRAGLEMAARLSSGGGSVGDAVRTAVVERLSPLFLAGCFEQVEAVLGQGPLPDTMLAVLTRELEEFTETFCREHEFTFQSRQPKAEGGEEIVSVMEKHPREIGPDLEDRIRKWYARLIPDTLHGRLVSVVGRDSWQQEIAGDRESWQREIDELAVTLVSNPVEFESEIPWLASTEARSVYHLGQSLGKADTSGTLVERVFQSAREGATGVARGYLEQVSTSNSSQLGRLNAALDKLQEEDARTAFDVLWSAGPEVRKVERVFGLVDAGHLPAELLRSLEREAYSGQLNQEQLAGAVLRTINAAEDGNAKAAVVAVRLLYAWLHPDRRMTGSERLANAPELVPMLRHALHAAVGSMNAAAGSVYLEPTFWLTLAEDLAAIDVASGAELLAKGITNRDFKTRQLAERHLVNLATFSPSEVMKAVGEVFLHPLDVKWLQLGNISALLHTIPEVIVKEWIGRNGLPAAQAIARHLPPPYLDEDKPIVSPLTEFVMETYEWDEHVFQEFVAGIRSRKVYTGDIASQYLEEVHTATRFLDHPLRRIRDWALSEIENARRRADYWKQRDEEDNLR